MLKMVTDLDDKLKETETRSSEASPKNMDNGNHFSRGVQGYVPKLDIPHSMVQMLECGLKMQ